MGGHPLSPLGVTGSTLAVLYSTVPPAEQARAIERMAGLGGVFEAAGLAARGIAAEPAEVREAA
jgi:hypothetical protein